ncbi:hypothetical protein B0H11DRAFT_2252647 [Mycena galericulata]|nr:hypothetical protein B0H11DRAFT_2252647 [Mycena galericulata]
MSSTSTFKKTNMTAAEMIPDHSNPHHDPRYWCLPPVRDRPSEAAKTGKYPVYLVVQGRIVGVWHNWQDGGGSDEGCVREWQEHCALGGHPHVADPTLLRENDGAFVGLTELVEALPAVPPTAVPPTKGAGLGRGRMVNEELQADLQKYCMPDLSGYTPSTVSSVSSTASSVSTSSSVKKARWNAVPHSARYYAIWRGGIVFTERSLAKQAFREAESAEGQAQVISTHDFEEAKAYSEGVYWISD